VLNRLLDADRYRAVHAAGRRPPESRHPKLVFYPTATFERLEFPALDDVFIALGTTIAAAGSPQAFRAIDRDAVVRFAEAARTAGATRIGVVSAMGADRASRVFYSRVKGEMEAAISELDFETVVFVRPALLAGDRDALEQRHRPAEKAILFAARWLKPLFPANYRAIDADAVAAGLIDGLHTMGPGRHVLLSGALQKPKK